MYINVRICNGSIYSYRFGSLQWRHIEHDGVSDHQPHDCLLKHLFRRRSKETSKLSVTGLCAENSPVTGEFPAQRASNTENVSIWWRHHDDKKIIWNYIKPNSIIMALCLIGVKSSLQWSWWSLLDQMLTWHYTCDKPLTETITDLIFIINNLDKPLWRVTCCVWYYIVFTVFMNCVSPFG